MFMSILRAASCGHPLHVRSVPRGARIVLMGAAIVSLYCGPMPQKKRTAKKNEVAKVGGTEKGSPPIETPPDTSERYPKPRPKGEPGAVVELRELIEGKLEEMVERYFVDPRGSYVIGLDSARVFVIPAWLKNEATVVRVFAITNMDVPVTSELTSFLLARNLDFVLGAFALDADQGAVWFNHNLIGEFLAPEELEATLAAVAETANQMDDEIKKQFGGRLYSEKPTDKISPPHSPGYL